MKDTQGKLAAWAWERLSHPIAYWLLREGITSHPTLIHALFHLFPVFTTLIFLLEDAILSENTYIWYWDGAPVEEVDDLLEDIHEHITRSAIPYGGDDYFVIATSLEAMPGEENGVDPAKLDDSLPFRRAITTEESGGNRWRDWKRGQGKIALQTILEKFRPGPRAPVTVIRVSLCGRAIARALLVMES